MCPFLPTLSSRSFSYIFSISFSVQFSRSGVSNTLRPHGLQHTRLPCPSPTSFLALMSRSLVQVNSFIWYDGKGWNIMAFSYAYSVVLAPFWKDVPFSIVLLNDFFFFFLVMPLYCYQPISLHPHAHMLSHVTPWPAAHQGSSVHGLFQARILEWLPFPSPYSMTFLKNQFCESVPLFQVSEFIPTSHCPDCYSFIFNLEIM